MAKKKSILRVAWSYIWPERGWKRYGQMLLIKLSKLKGTPQSIAAGCACGVAISFTPFVGFHFVLAALTAWLVRGNLIASAVGTAAGNPWTFPFIWVSVLYSGREFLKYLPFHYSQENSVDFLYMFGESIKSILSLNYEAFMAKVWPIFFPMLIGSIPFYIVSWVVSYVLLKKILERLAKLKQNRQQRRASV